MEVMTRFEIAAKTGHDANFAALNVCRVAFAESLNGVDLTTEAFTNYNGPLKEVIAFECEGYFQAAYDILKSQSSPSPKPTSPDKPN